MSSTIKEALQRASFCLQRAGCGNPVGEAAALLAASLGVTRAWLYAHGEEKPEAAELQHYFAWVARRADGEPYAYLTGEKEFMSLSFLVTPAVLIPRPETELLVETAVRELKGRENLRILDLGTGSGAVAISIAVLLPESEVVAVDISPAALHVATQNAARHGVTNRVRFLAGDLYAPVCGERFDAIVSNPPYISSTDIETLERDVKDFEPRLALSGGPDGLNFYRRLTAELALLAAPPALLLFEVGYRQSEAVAALCYAAGYKNISQLNDLAGIPRIILAKPAGTA
ncbi:MAG: peptide chain release factor N(5)-glutamine methyltransferase [Dethiobacter sp.]|jgi:release factor glutamine methyltransferase|nr:peptide chain release factor N(5)-glutamine methyltransferase [Dethiobacter sp.]MBS3899294.1 peptide chain release factor N(5)-glutamine methyltransferase [Dethiobacter sp.]MBS3982748.1 peptide chain release factor N(5)-glutamine methyltransferase [Dethiobacter sp.]MCL4462718.1 peptide chain release factor N(5)-glutamine methyltransferase [Bacillota bacterium]MCL5994409.1 peptide chain release factor N(5)-glutamine methyltransferase [Bacillota bacterium]